MLCVVIKVQIQVKAIKWHFGCHPQSIDVDDRLKSLAYLTAIEFASKTTEHRWARRVYPRKFAIQLNGQKINPTL